MPQHKILINGNWREAETENQFQAFNPETGDLLADSYPVSNWNDCEAALDAASEAFVQMQKLPRAVTAKFLESYANKIEANSEVLVDMANLETGLPKSPRLAVGELPRTVSQLRLAAKAVIDASWTNPTIDTANNIRSMLQAIGPVAIFGPNNFPFAFGSISGGDFAAAFAAGNPVIAKAHPSHPGTTRIFAELAQEAASESGLPDGSIQLLYAMSNDCGLKLVSDKRIAATGFTGSRAAGLALKKAADEAGKLIYLELSSINPVFVLEGALKESSESIADEFAGSCLMVAGQLCTKPGLLIVPEGDEGDGFVKSVTEKFDTGAMATLLSESAASNISNTLEQLTKAGGELLTNKTESTGKRFCHNNALVSIDGNRFINDSDTFQSEMFGNASLIIRSNSTEQSKEIIKEFEGNLTGCIYSDTEGSDDADYDQLEPLLRTTVGRVINDKMPTGVAVSSAMNHGGPYPSSGHPGFTAVGLPASIKRFGALKCFDGVRAHRLPDVLADTNPLDKIWRLVDGEWTTNNI
jgi:alpha-ketoglutaric semialdehyde dehydrogenase